MFKSWADALEALAAIVVITSVARLWANLRGSGFSGPSNLRSPPTRPVTSLSMPWTCGIA